MPALLERERVFAPRGAAQALLFDRREPEVGLSGPAGTGKSRACFEYVHKCLLDYSGARALVLRKTLTSLTASGLVTYRERVLDPLDRVEFFGGSRAEPAAYRYPNGSRLVVGGMDKPAKVMSTEYDLIYVQEATELAEGEYESLTTRLRNGVMPWQQLLYDCNPDRPTHWLKQRANANRCVMLESRHDDNPAVTPEYLATLDRLSGVRYQRLRLGQWAAAEGLVYDGWDRAKHLIDARSIPAEWPRYWVLDFGFTNPFCCQWWAQDPDGRLYRYRELYVTHRLVEDAAVEILRYSGDEPKPRAVICDHDAEGRATFERHAKVTTLAAYKAVQDGIQAVAARLKAAGDGKPRLFLMRGALVAPDPARVEAKRPTCTEEEVEGYIWDTSNGRKKGEEPVKDDDHGCDAMRYLVAYIDKIGQASRKVLTW